MLKNKLLFAHPKTRDESELEKCFFTSQQVGRGHLLLGRKTCVIVVQAALDLCDR